MLTILPQGRVDIDAVQRSAKLNLVGVMSYDAFVAGVGDSSAGFLNSFVRHFKSLTIDWLTEYRGEIKRLLDQMGIQLEFYNGGGSGSIAVSAADPTLTEVTAGSGFLQSHLFDEYNANVNEPALIFALPVSRIPQPDRVTCFSGGFIASGWPIQNRMPQVYRPEGLRVDSREGFGEVQTPLHVPEKLHGKFQVGDPIFFRPAKAGEIAERFSEYHLFREDGIVDRVKTYRGHGQCFF